MSTASCAPPHSGRPLAMICRLAGLAREPKAEGEEKKTEEGEAEGSEHQKGMEKRKINGQRMKTLQMIKEKADEKAKEEDEEESEGGEEEEPVEKISNHVILFGCYNVCTNTKQVQ